MKHIKKIALATCTAAAMTVTLAAAQAQKAGATKATHPDSVVQMQHVMSIGSRRTGLGQFKYVEDFAQTADGHIAVTDAAHAWVQVFDKTSGEFVARFGGKGDNDENLEKPEGISVATNGDIYVADYTTGEVEIYDREYKWKKSFSEYGSEPGQNIKSEFTDIRNGLYYMPEAGNHRVSVWDLEGNFKFTFGSRGTAPGQMNNPETSKFNSEGKLYVTDLKNDRIQVFDDKGKFLFTFGQTGSGPGDMKAPAGLSIDAQDRVFISEIGNDRIQIFDKTGTWLGMFGQGGSADGEFGNLHGIFIDKETGWLYVGDTKNNRVQVFKPLS